ncbi:NAD-dependent malic enzyme [Gaeumannomyces tritici R3-111a-1]|uniref:Malic enzyme n=1 Tax=Gaeumannomyces tritici (strain R3-111a-1) TaxID=644352 RepID=J3NMA1_GAET3|nr:NAD-dependent malic enzyme [Gaeumannomyces tritici R3-111a-1]EJT82432.1 NAD-dependent malic enzyme [Gaeumannomyces tritici R3-111a-1]
MPGTSKFAHLPLSTSGPLECALAGTALLNHPFFNKGTAFTKDERRDFDLSGLLPQNVQSLEQQVERAYAQYSAQANDLAKNSFLTSLKEQNEVLFFRLLHDNLPEMFSVVYTPTEGDAIQDYSRLFRRPEGCFLNVRDAGRVRHDLAQWGRAQDVDYIVVSDGEEILGIGDQGCGGILISSAKLTLATLCGGVHPNRTLPVVLDCGTDNEALLRDPLYLGLRERRVRGEPYDALVDEFVRAARDLFPRAYIHFEDFGLANARRILERYRPRVPCFNDDVQGTGCVALAAIMAGLRVAAAAAGGDGDGDRGQGRLLAGLRLVVFGGGSAGMGIADQVRDAVAAERGVSKAEAARQIWVVDRPGLLTTGVRTDDAQRAYARPEDEWRGRPTDLLGVVREVKPNVLVGTSTVPGAFTRDLVEAMAQGADRPVIMPLSNPTRLHEAVPADLLAWTGGRALVATGSPFEPVRGPWGEGGEEVEVEVAECNNSVVFPGIGLGCVLSRARLLTDRMLVAAVRELAALSPARADPTAPLLPGVDAVRDVSVAVAKGVIREAVDEGVATEEGIPGDDGELDEWIREQMWSPVYRPLRRVDMGSATREAKGELKIAGTLGK